MVSEENGRRTTGTLPSFLGAGLSGVLYFLGFCGFGYYPLIFVCFVPVLLAIEGQSLKRTLFLGLFFGWVTNLGGYYWVVHLLESFASFPRWAAVLGFWLLCLYQGALLAFVLLLVSWLRQAYALSPVFSLPVTFVSLEFVYPLLFPSYIGNALPFGYFAQIVEITGMLGLTVVIATSNGLAYELVRTRLLVRDRSSVPRILFPLVVVGGAFAFGFFRTGQIEDKMRRSRSLKAGLVQANLGARDKKEKQHLFIKRHQEMTREMVQAHPDLEVVVWPESAYNKWIHRETGNLAAQVGDFKKPLIFGAITFSGTRQNYQIYNSAVLTSSTGEVRGLF